MLCKSDIEMARTPLELREWYARMHEQLTGTEEDIERYRISVGKYVKQFREEVYPTLIYLESRYGDDAQVSYKPAIGSQRFDGEVLNPDGERLEYIECTMAVDGHTDKLRAEVLNIEGHVDAHSGAIHPGVKGDRPNLQFPSTTVEVGSIIDGLARLVNVAIHKKAKKHYTVEPTLLVAVGDHLLLHKNEAYYQELLSCASSVVSECGGDFRSVWLVSMARETAFRLDEGSAATSD